METQKFEITRDSAECLVVIFGGSSTKESVSEIHIWSNAEWVLVYRVSEKRLVGSHERIVTTGERSGGTHGDGV
jgi:hypothetical protein